jgi:wyosine [tRNA(Phe)-imidazoG37] synthetase (radical SAM superfamily)
LAELEAMLVLAVSGEIFETELFRQTPQPLRRLNDIAFSGDGEPTTYRNFDQIVAAVAQTKRNRAPDDVKLVLITNASMFHRPEVQRGLEIMDENNGEIWAKLETGTEEYYRRVARSRIPFRRILENISEAARRRPIVIQSLFMRIEDAAPPESEITAFCERLNEILGSGGRIKLVQVHTIARPPAERWVQPLTPQELETIAAVIERRTGLQTEVYSGAVEQSP